MVRLSAIIISLFLVFSFQAQAKSPPPGTGTSDIPANILIGPCKIYTGHVNSGFNQT